MRNHIDSATEDNDARSDNDAMSIVETVGIIYRKKKVIHQSSCGL